jgi:hypothetical protein
MAHALELWLFASGHAVDVVLVVIVVELAWLVTAGRWQMSQAALRLAPGVFILLALRGALTGSDWRWIALPLALAFPLHLADLMQRTGQRR